MTIEVRQMVIKSEVEAGGDDAQGQARDEHAGDEADLASHERGLAQADAVREAIARQARLRER
ncbi:hypothetical protein [Chitinimonas naiadis]